MSYGYGYGPAHPQYGRGRYGSGRYGFGQVVRLSAPVSVHIVAILQYLGGLLGLLAAGLIALAWSTGGETLGDPSLPAQVRGAGTSSGLVLAAVVAIGSLVAMVIGRKLQRGRQWARVVVLLLCTLNLLGTLYTAFVLDLRPAGVAAGVGPALYLLLLNTSAARSWFRYGTY